MKAHALLFPVKIMCRVLGVARSGFYAWCSRRASMRHQRRVELDQQASCRHTAHAKVAAGLHGCATICGKQGYPAIARRLPPRCNGKDCAPGPPGSTKPRRTPDTRCRCQRICSSRISRHRRRIRDGLVTSPTCTLRKAGRPRRAVLGGSHRPVLTDGDWLGHGRAHDDRSGLRCLAHGAMATQAAQGRNCAQRPWLASTAQRLTRN